MSDTADNSEPTFELTEASVAANDNVPTANATAEPADDGAAASTSDAIIEMKSYEKVREAFRNRDVAATRTEHAKRGPHNHHEAHGGSGSEYIKSIVFGGLDGTITTFAVIAAAAGSNEPFKTVLIFGFANLLADASSMGFGEFVSGNAEREYALKEREREEWEVENCPDVEIQEMVELYQNKGISEEDARTMVGIISKDSKLFVDFMMIDELQILVDIDDKYGPMKQGAVTFLSFVCFGLIPLLVYLGGKGQGADWVFGVSVALTGVSLLCLGAVKGFLTDVNIFFSALMMLVNGTISGGMSYGVGVLVEYIVSNA